MKHCENVLRFTAIWGNWGLVTGSRNGRDKAVRSGIRRGRDSENRLKQENTNTHVTVWQYQNVEGESFGCVMVWKLQRFVTKPLSVAVCYVKPSVNMRSDL
jgi:hypothetical protein